MESIDRERFGKFVCELRKEKDLTQQELAERLFISNKAVSKWERGQSLPDIELLMPLAETLEVSVAELLKGERLTATQMENCEVKELVENAVRLSAEELERRRENRKVWRLSWGICAGLVFLETALLVHLGEIAKNHLETYLVVELLTLGFAAYFCFGVKEVLPKYYDEGRISNYSDGVFRMNLPGVRLNNSNWPHIVRAARGWLLGGAVVWPALYLLVRGGVPIFLTAAALADCLSFFIPMVIVGKRFE